MSPSPYVNNLSTQLCDYPPLLVQKCNNSGSTSTFPCHFVWYIMAQFTYEWSLETLISQCWWWKSQTFTIAISVYTRPAEMNAVVVTPGYLLNVMFLYFNSTRMSADSLALSMKTVTSKMESTCLFVSTNSFGKTHVMSLRWPNGSVKQIYFLCQKLWQIEKS